MNGASLRAFISLFSNIEAISFVFSYWYYSSKSSISLNIIKKISKILFLPIQPATNTITLSSYLSIVSEVRPECYEILYLFELVLSKKM